MDEQISRRGVSRNPKLILGDSIYSEEDSLDIE